MNPIELPTRRRLEFAEGYLMLGLVREAKAEIEAIEIKDHYHPEVMEGRMSLYYATGEWKRLDRLARAFTQMYPEREQGWLSLAFAVRRDNGVAAAKEVLLAAEPRLQSASGVLSYNLGCYHCLLGELDAARGRLRKAFARIPHLRQEAKADSDLTALWGELDGLKG